MRVVIAIVLAAHGVAHLVGFVASWRLADLRELPYKTTVFAGHLDVGDAGVKAIGVLWLVAALAFVASGAAVAFHADWAARFTALMVVVSLILCAAGWPDARIGVGVNVAVGVLLVIIARRV